MKSSSNSISLRNAANHFNVSTSYLIKLLYQEEIALDFASLSNQFDYMRNDSRRLKESKKARQELSEVDRQIENESELESKVGEASEASEDTKKKELEEAYKEAVSDPERLAEIEEWEAQGGHTAKNCKNRQRPASQKKPAN